jgi:hypothetical protein
MCQQTLYSAKIGKSGQFLSALLILENWNNVFVMEILGKKTCNFSNVKVFVLLIMEMGLF